MTIQYLRRKVKIEMELEVVLNQTATDRTVKVIPKEAALVKQEKKSAWTIEASEELYRINGWGEPYFSINAAGHVTVSPKGDRGGSLDLYELVEALKQRNLGLPILIRFSDILADRLERLQACFAKAIERYKYPGIYQGVFPVKCNQNRQLIEDLVAFGQPHQFGLEAGSKPELMKLGKLPPKNSTKSKTGVPDFSMFRRRES